MNDDNIVKFERRGDNRDGKPKNNEPFINLPPVTKYLLLGMVSIHLVLYLLIPADVRAEIILTFGFVPYLWTDGNLFGLTRYRTYHRSPIWVYTVTGCISR